MSAIAANPRLASCKRTPPVSSNNTARVAMPLRLSSAASSSAPAIFAPPTSPRLPPWNAPSMAAITTGKPPMRPLAITTPSSACGTTPWRDSQGDMMRWNGSSNSRKEPLSSRALARCRAPSSTKLCLFNNAALSVMADLLEALFQTQTHHAGGRTEIVDINRHRRWRLAVEHPRKQMLPALFGAIDRGLHLDRQLAGLTGFDQHFQIARANTTHQGTAPWRLPGGEFKGQGFHQQTPWVTPAPDSIRSMNRQAAS